MLPTEVESATEGPSAGPIWLTRSKLVSSYCRGRSCPIKPSPKAMYSRPKRVVDAKNNPGLTALAAIRESVPVTTSSYKFPSESSTRSRWTRFVVMYVFNPLISGTPASGEYCETRPGRVCTPPGKNATSANDGDIPAGTSDGSRSVTQVPKVLSGIAEKVSIDIGFEAAE